MRSWPWRWQRDIPGSPSDDHLIGEGPGRTADPGRRTVGEPAGRFTSSAVPARQHITSGDPAGRSNIDAGSRPGAGDGR